jgi:hypothetical protein
MFTANWPKLTFFILFLVSFHRKISFIMLLKEGQLQKSIFLMSMFACPLCGVDKSLFEKE